MAGGTELGIAGAIEGVAAVLLAAILVIRSGRRPGPIVLGLNFLAFAAILFLLSVPEMLDRTTRPTEQLGIWIARLVLWTSLIAFASVYPARSLTPRRRWFLAWSVIPALAIAVGFVVLRDLFIASDGGPTQLLRDLVTLLRDVGLLLSLAVFGRAYLTAPPGHRRQQALYILIPYTIYGLNDGLAVIVPAVRTPGNAPLLFLLLSVAIVAGVLALAALALRRRLAAPPGEGKRDRLFLLWVALSIPAAFVQFIEVTAPGDGVTAAREHSLFLHFLVDGVAILVLFYGVAKEQILDIDLKLRWTIRSGTVASIVLAVFFIVANVAQNYFSDKYPYLLGGVATGLVLFAIQPIQRVAERFANAAVPRAVPLHEMGDLDRIDLFRQQAELAWADGAVTRNEQLLLRNLRDRLHIPTVEAERIEAQAMKRSSKRA